MKKSLLLSLFFMLLTSGVLPAQKNFTDGGIIRVSGDTIRGQIDYREWDINPENIQFRQAPSEGIEVYSVRSIAGFFVNEKNEIYQTASVYLNNEPSDTRNLPDYSSIGEALRGFKPIRDTVFLRVLVRGQLSLFEYSDKNRQHFLAQPTGDTIRELIFREIKVSNSPVSLEEYKRQLQFATIACQNLGINFDKLPYQEKSLLDVAVKFNQCSQNSIYIEQPEKAGKYFYAMAGAAFPFFELSGPFLSPITNDEKYTLTGAGPLLGIGCDFNFSRGRGRRGVGAEVFATRYSLDYKDKDFFERDVNYKVEMGYLRMLGYFRQNIATGRISPYLKAGVGGSYYFESSVSYTTISSVFGTIEHVRPTKKGDVCLMGGLGVRAERFFTEVRFEWGSNLAEFDASETLRANVISVIAGYKIFK